MGTWLQAVVAIVQQSALSMQVICVVDPRNLCLTDTSLIHDLHDATRHEHAVPGRATWSLRHEHAITRHEHAITRHEHAMSNQM